MKTISDYGFFLYLMGNIDVCIKVENGELYENITDLGPIELDLSTFIHYEPVNEGEGA